MSRDRLHHKRHSNLGTTGLKRRKRSQDPMVAYDQLPKALRLWMQEAKLPWSPASCRAVWRKTKARGDSLEQTLASLDRAEAATLARTAKLARSTRLAQSSTPS